MNLLKRKKSDIKNSEINEDFFLNRDVLNKNELNQIKGGTTEGDDDDDGDDKLIDPI